MLYFTTEERYMNASSKTPFVRLALCATVLAWMTAHGFAAVAAPHVAAPQVAHGPTFPPDPWDGKVA